MDFLKEIKDLINELIVKANYTTKFRSPLVGCAAAGDQVFKDIKKITYKGHMQPEDLLPGARSVVAFFLPYSEEVVWSNRRKKMVSREWAIAYVETNKLIADICKEARKRFAGLGVRVVWEQPTYSFDKKKLMASWSHRHAAYAAGLGTFGLNNLLITDAGCAGRVGSFAVDVEIEPTPKPEGEKCLYKKSGKCGRCIDLCPTKALTKEGFDRSRCYKWLLKVDNYYSDLPLTDVCGKCSLGVCALGVPEL